LFADDVYELSMLFSILPGSACTHTFKVWAILLWIHATFIHN